MREGVIVLVEDNPDDVALALRAFKRNDIRSRVVVARDGAEALEYLFSEESLKEPPQVVLLDLKLPKLDGLEVLKKLKHNPKTRLFPVVILTGSKEEEDLAASYGLGANSYIRKPVEFERFSQTIKKLACYWLALNEPPPGKKGADGLTTPCTDY